MAEPLQCQCRYTVARWRSIVRTGLEPHDQLLMIRAGEEKSACLSILITSQQRLRQALRKGYILHPEPRLNQLQERANQIGMIIEVRVQMRMAILAGR